MSGAPRRWPASSSSPACSLPGIRLRWMSRPFGQRTARVPQHDHRRERAAHRPHRRLGAKGFGPGADVDRLLARLDKLLEAAKVLAAPLLCVDLGPLPPPPPDDRPKPKVTAEMAGLLVLPDSSAFTAVPAPESTNLSRIPPPLTRRLRRRSMPPWPTSVNARTVTASPSPPQRIGRLRRAGARVAHRSLPVVRRRSRPRRHAQRRMERRRNYSPGSARRSATCAP